MIYIIKIQLEKMKFLNIKEKILIKLLVISITIEVLKCLNHEQIDNTNNNLNRDRNIGLNLGNSKINPINLNWNSKSNRLDLNLHISKSNRTNAINTKKIVKAFLTDLEKEIPFFGEWVQIRNIDNDFCIKYEGENKKVIQSLCGSNDVFLWKIEKLPKKEGIYKIMSKKNSTYALDINVASLNKTLKAVAKITNTTNNNINIKINTPIAPIPNLNPGQNPSLIPNLNAGANPNPNPIPIVNASTNPISNLNAGPNLIPNLNLNPNPINPSNNNNIPLGSEDLNIPKREFRLNDENINENIEDIAANPNDPLNGAPNNMKKSNPNTKKLNAQAQKKVNSVRNELNFGIKNALSAQKSSNATTQVWQIEKFKKKNFFVFKNSKSGTCMDNTGLPLAGREYQVFQCNKINKNQAFYFYKPIENPFKNDTINIVSLNSKNCMKGVENKGRIVQAKCDEAKQYQWKIVKNFVYDGFFFLESKLGEFVLENLNWGKKVGNPVILSKPKGSPNQLWELLYFKDKKHYLLKNRQAKKCLGNSGKIKGNAFFSLWECDENNPNLAFLFVRPRDNKFIKIVIPGLTDNNVKKNNVNAATGKNMSFSRKRKTNLMNVNASKNSNKKKDSSLNSSGNINKNNNFSLNPSKIINKNNNLSLNPNGNSNKNNNLILHPNRNSNKNNDLSMNSNGNSKKNNELSLNSNGNSKKDNDLDINNKKIDFNPNESI